MSSTVFYGAADFTEDVKKIAQKLAVAGRVQAVADIACEWVADDRHADEMRAALQAVGRLAFVMWLRDHPRSS